jgi:hypothetical protein
MRASCRNTAPPLRCTPAATPASPCASHTPPIHCTNCRQHPAACLSALACHSAAASTQPVLQPAARPRATLKRRHCASHTPPIRRHCAALAALPLRRHYAAPPANPHAITPQICHIAPLWHHPTGHAQNGPHAPPKPRKLAPIFLGGTTPTYVPCWSHTIIIFLLGIEI